MMEEMVEMEELVQLVFLLVSAVLLSAELLVAVPEELKQEELLVLPLLILGESGPLAHLVDLNHLAWASIFSTTKPIKINTNPIMKTENVGVKYPGLGTPASVAGMAVRAEGVAVGLGVSFGVGVGEGIIVAEGVAVKAGSSLSPAAKTVKV